MMMNQLIRMGKVYILIIALAVIMTLFLRCNSNHAPEIAPRIPKRITEIIFSEDESSWIVTIKGNQALTYTALNQVSPIGVLFHFPDTTLDLLETVHIPPDNQTIGSIEADQIVVDRTKTARIWIRLKMNKPYDVFPDEAGLKISFPKTAVLSKDIKAQKESADEKHESKPAENVVPAASLLNTVTATAFNNHIIVHLDADGTIKDYHSFALENPARIVFDIYNIKSPHEKEQIIAVESKWVKQIRYLAYADKIRLVLDTYDDFLRSYSSLAVNTGLLIYIGRNPEVLNKTS